MNSILDFSFWILDSGLHLHAPIIHPKVNKAQATNA